MSSKIVITICFMGIIISIIFGAVQGLTEFLPISSSGHLILLHDILQIKDFDSLTFDVALHWGTLVALAIFFYNDILKYLQAFFKSFFQQDWKNNLDAKIAWLILLSMFPSLIIGYFWENIIENIFRSALSVAIVLITVSFLFFLAEKYAKKTADFTSLNWRQVLVIGFAQAVALIPGVSRSGITIITGMFFNLKREAAARFSFLMSIPIVFAAGVKKALDAYEGNLLDGNYLIYLLGFLSAAFIGYLAIKYFLQIVQKYSLNWFAYYRLALGAIIIIYFLVK